MNSDAPKKIIGLFGGSFNPPHVAHVLAAGWALSAGGMDEIWVIPTGGHPFGKSLAPFEDRLAMCELAFSCYGARIRVLDIEREPRVHYSVETVETLTRENPDCEFRWIIGSDALEQSREWREFDRLAKMAPPLVIGRMGHSARAAQEKLKSQYEISAFALPDISSTLIRDRLSGQAPASEDLAGLIPGSVLRHIRAHHLYE
ncbi:nicotinate (nicotinamide) nucleotide adenylyltransferase [Candidatus Sumerlaeota bacterium]|nr:nicotinate (nicotinamide) nucleotide adenylyltransferase [Candidatus Sumerlaeota bacterium]